MNKNETDEHDKSGLVHNPCRQSRWHFLPLVGGSSRGRVKDWRKNGCWEWWGWADKCTRWTRTRLMRLTKWIRKLIPKTRLAWCILLAESVTMVNYFDYTIVYMSHLGLHYVVHKNVVVNLLQQLLQTLADFNNFCITLTTMNEWMMMMTLTRINSTPDSTKMSHFTMRAALPCTIWKRRFFVPEWPMESLLSVCPSVRLSVRNVRHQNCDHDISKTS